MSITYKEAIRRLKAMPKNNEAIEMAIEVMKRQTPVRAKHVDHHYECECGVWILMDDEIPNWNDNFCPRCGRKFLWDEVTE